MADAVAGRAFEHHGIFQLALFLSSFENDLVDAITHAHHLTAEFNHRRREQELFMLSFSVECLLYLSQSLHSDHVAGLQTQRSIAVAVAGPGDVAPAVK